MQDDIEPGILYKLMELVDGDLLPEDMEPVILLTVADYTWFCKLATFGSFAHRKLYNCRYYIVPQIEESQACLMQKLTKDDKCYLTNSQDTQKGTGTKS